MSTVYDPVMREFQERGDRAEEPSSALPSASAWPSGTADGHRRHHRRRRRQFYEMLAYWLIVLLSSAGLCAAIWWWSQTPQYKLSQRWHQLPAGPHTDRSPYR